MTLILVGRFEMGDYLDNMGNVCGLMSKRFPRGDDLSHDNANYKGLEGNMNQWSHL